MRHHSYVLALTLIITITQTFCINAQRKYYDAMIHGLKGNVKKVIITTKSNLGEYEDFYSYNADGSLNASSTNEDASQFTRSDEGLVFQKCTTSDNDLEAFLIGILTGVYTNTTQSNGCESYSYAYLNDPKSSDLSYDWVLFQVSYEEDYDFLVKYRYDDSFQDLVEIEYLILDIPNIERYEIHQKDSHGNWIRRTTYNEDGDWICDETRSITYHDHKSILTSPTNNSIEIQDETTLNVGDSFYSTVSLNKPHNWEKPSLSDTIISMSAYDMVSFDFGLFDKNKTPDQLYKLLYEHNARPQKVRGNDIEIVCEKSPNPGSSNMCAEFAIRGGKIHCPHFSMSKDGEIMDYIFTFSPQEYYPSNKEARNAAMDFFDELLNSFKSNSDLEFTPLAKKDNELLKYGIPSKQGYSILNIYYNNPSFIVRLQVYP